MLQKFIDWIMSLLGLKKLNDNLGHMHQQLGAGNHNQPGYVGPAQQQSFPQPGQQSGGQMHAPKVRLAPGAPGTKVADFYANPAKWQEHAQDAGFTMEQMEMSCRERDGREAGEDCPPAMWQDEWGPLNKDRLDEFLFHMFEIEDNQPDPAKQKANLQKFGYQSREQYEWVKLTFAKHYGTDSGSGTVDGFMLQSNQVQSMMMAARMKQTQAKQDAHIAENQHLLVPVEGVTLEQYGAISAQQARGLSMPEFQALLAQNGMDQAKFDRVSGEWMKRMSMDTTATIATIYGKAFSGAGAGQYGAAAAAGAAAMGATGASGQMHVAGGAEPCTFDKYCEIGGAQQAWSASGKDVNAMLKQVFNLSALDWSNLSSYWMTKMMADISMMTRMTEIQQHYAQKYAAPKADQDLQF